MSTAKGREAGMSTNRNPPRWTTSLWHGMDNFECTASLPTGKRCPFATLDKGEIIRHARQKHPRGWENVPVPDHLADVVFASRHGADAAEEAVKAGTDAGRLATRILSSTPSGATGYTKGDVLRAVEALTTTLEE